jgi:enoyl-CoA hydratase/carnithine racemase
VVTDRGDGSVLLTAVPGAAATEAWPGLGAALRALPGSARVVVLAAELFAVLVDWLSWPAPVEEGEQGLIRWQESVRRLDRADLVSVAALGGRVEGAALDLALGCDLRVVALDARLAVVDVARGGVPALGGLARLRTLAGPARALELALTARSVSAAEAVALGLATLAVPHAELPAATDDLTAALLAVPRAAAVEAKALLRAAGDPLTDPLAAARAAALRLAVDDPG